MTLWSTYVYLGQLHRKKGDDQPCAEAYAEAMKMYPNEKLAGNMVHCFRRAKNATRSVEVHTEITQRHPSSGVGWLGLGAALMELKRPLEAQRAFTRLLSIDPRSARALYGLALSQVMARDADGAARTLELLEQVDPELADRFVESMSK